MENIIDVAKDVIGLFTREPWYVKVSFIVGALVILVFLFFLLVLCAEVTKTLFTIDFLVIGAFIYNCFEEGLPDMGGIITGVVLCVILAVLFFFIMVADDEEKGVIELFFDSLLGGVVNIGALLLIGTIILIPLVAVCWSTNDRY